MEAIPSVVCDTLYSMGLHDQVGVREREPFHMTSDPTNLTSFFILSLSVCEGAFMEDH